MDPNFALLIAIFVGLYTSYGTVGKMWCDLNQCRNTCLQDGKDASKNLAVRKLIYYNDWLPMWVGLLAFLILFTGLLIALPLIVQGSDAHMRHNLRFACWSATFLPIGGFIGFLLGGIGDIKSIHADFKASQTEETTDDKKEVLAPTIVYLHSPTKRKPSIQQLQRCKESHRIARRSVSLAGRQES